MDSSASEAAAPKGAGSQLAVVVGPDREPAVELTNKIAKAAMNYGLLIRTSGYGHGNVFKIRPPLIISAAEAEYLCDQLEKLLEDVA